MDRAVRLEGAFNFRDLGGVLTSTGDMVRTGRLYRADALSALTDLDLEILAGKRLATVIDLRTSHELEHHGRTRLVDSGARHLHVPMLEGLSTTKSARKTPPSLGELYVQMVEDDSDRFVQILDTIARPDSLPAVFHCSAGKDRTGVTASLILGMLNVPKETIIADYVVTDVNVQTMLKQRRMEGKSHDIESYPASYIRALPETMEQFLEIIEKRWGSTNGYLHHIGVSQSTRDAITNEMLA